MTDHESSRHGGRVWRAGEGPSSSEKSDYNGHKREHEAERPRMLGFSWSQGKVATPGKGHKGGGNEP